MRKLSKTVLWKKPDAYMDGFRLIVLALVVILGFGVIMIGVMEAGRLLKGPDVFIPYFDEYNQGYSYLIFKNETDFTLAKNGQTGIIDYASLNSHTTIQATIEAVADDGGGLIFMRAGNYSIAEPILPREYVTLQGSGPSTIINISGDNTAFLVTDVSHAVIRDLDIAVAYGQVKPVIHVLASSSQVTYCVMENIRIRNDYSGNNVWTNIFMEVSGVTYIMQNTFKNIKSISYSSKLINFNISNPAGWINANHFENLWCMGYRQGIDFTEALGGHELSHNTFKNVNLQSEAYSTDGIKNVWKTSNIFEDIFIWDWSAAVSPNYRYSFASGSWGNMVITSQPSVPTTDVLDLGSHNTFIGPRNLIFQRNYGYTVMASGESVVVVEHWMLKAPTGVILTGTTNDTSALWVTNINATHFTINAPATVGGNRWIYWEAWYKP